MIKTFAVAAALVIGLSGYAVAQETATPAGPKTTPAHRSQPRHLHKKHAPQKVKGLREGGLI
jgi:hypothetical protein